MNKNLSDWALESLIHCKIQKEVIDKLLLKAKYEQDFIEIIRFLSTQKINTAEGIENLFRYAGQSRFAIDEWISALVVFIEYLKSKKLTSRIDVMLGYMSCVDQSQEAKIGQISFKQLLSYHLETNGFENKIS